MIQIILLRLSKNLNHDQLMDVFPTIYLRRSQHDGLRYSTLNYTHIYNYTYMYSMLPFLSPQTLLSTKVIFWKILPDLEQLRKSLPTKQILYAATVLLTHTSQTDPIMVCVMCMDKTQSDVHPSMIRLIHPYTVH